ncbi:hypothetical protein NH14_003295 [Paraburkholderia sacchari]|nr:hypothetical protein [Paraburkholderia sacchari]
MFEGQFGVVGFAPEHTITECRVCEDNRNDNERASQSEGLAPPLTLRAAWSSDLANRDNRDNRDNELLR